MDQLYPNYSILFEQCVTNYYTTTKSPDDGMTIDDFFKTLGYAFLYKGLGEKVNQIPLSELTVSLFRASVPKELLNQLSKEGYIIEKQVPGIYYVNGLLVPTQIVVTNQLNSQNHESLKVLSKSAQTDDIQRFTDLIRKPRPFRGDFVMWLEIILIFPFFVFRKTEMF